MGESARTAFTYESVLLLPVVGNVPIVAFVPPGAEA